METIKAVIEVLEENQKVLIKGIENEDLEVDFSKDVDFTNVIESLTDQIDISKQIELSIPNGFDEGKIEVVLTTLSQIFKKYNESITASNEDGQTNIDLDSDEDDLPF